MQPSPNRQRNPTAAANGGPCPPRPTVLRRFDRSCGKRILRVWAAWLVAACVTPAVAAGQISRGASLGPLATEDGAPLHRVGLTAAAEPADPLPAGAIRWDIGVAYSNIFEHDSTTTHVLVVDMERLIKTTQVRVGVTDRVEVGGRLTFETTGGGALDGFVTWWHKRVGAPNANRELVSNGHYDQRLESSSHGIVLNEPRRMLGLEDVRLFAKWMVVGAEASPSALSVRASARIPTTSSEHVQERTDVGVSVLGRLSGARWHGHAMLGMATVRAFSPLDPDLFRNRSYHGMIGVERALGSRLAAIVQYKVSTPLLASFGHRVLDGPSGNLVFGIAGRVGDAWRWDASFQEDLPADTPAPDFTLGVSVSRVW